MLDVGSYYLAVANPHCLRPFPKTLYLRDRL